MRDELQAPFPWFGGKSRATNLVWPRFGKVENYVEPFYGSGAMLLGRPNPSGNETINDIDGFVANAWRSIKLSPEETATHADNPVNENDLHARHSWLVAQRDTLRSRLEGDPDFHDPKIAGFWIWGSCCWIAAGFCFGNGPWQVVDGKLVHLGSNGRGVNRQLVHLGRGRGVNRRLVHLGSNGQGVNRKRGIYEWFVQLSDRMRRVRVCSGDWSRVCGPSVTFKHGMTAVFLDPPYADTANRCSNLYSEDSLSVAHDVRLWCIENGDNPLLRIALCGYEGEHEMPCDWECVEWKAAGGYASQGEDRENAKRERIWFSPVCLRPEKAQLSMF